VPAPVGPENVEVLGEFGHVVLEGPRVRQSRVQEHQRLARAVLLVVGVYVAELYVVGHLLLPLVV
jgi:hypothetical protein